MGLPILQTRKQALGTQHTGVGRATPQACSLRRRRPGEGRPGRAGQAHPALATALALTFSLRVSLRKKMRQRKMKERSWATQRPTQTTCRPNVSARGTARPAWPQWAPAIGRGRAGGCQLAPGFLEGGRLGSCGQAWGQLCNPHVGGSREWLRTKPTFLREQEFMILQSPNGPSPLVPALPLSLLGASPSPP